MAQLREATLADDASGGSVFIARLAHLATVNQSLGREATDELLRRFGKGARRNCRAAPAGCRRAPQRRRLLPWLLPGAGNRGYRRGNCSPH